MNNVVMNNLGQELKFDLNEKLVASCILLSSNAIEESPKQISFPFN